MKRVEGPFNDLDQMARISAGKVWTKSANQRAFSTPVISANQPDNVRYAHTGRRHNDIASSETKQGNNFVSAKHCGEYGMTRYYAPQLLVERNVRLGHYGVTKTPSRHRESVLKKDIAMDDTMTNRKLMLMKLLGFTRLHLTQGPESSGQKGR